MVEADPARGDPSGMSAAPKAEKGALLLQENTRRTLEHQDEKPQVRALDWGGTLGNNVLHKSPHGFRPQFSNLSWQIMGQIMCLHQKAGSLWSWLSSDTTSPARVFFRGVVSIDILGLGKPSMWHQQHILGLAIHHGVTGFIRFLNWKYFSGNTSALRSESQLRVTHLKTTIYWAYSRCQSMLTKDF